VPKPREEGAVTHTDEYDDLHEGVELDRDWRACEAAVAAGDLLAAARAGTPNA